MSTHVYVSRYHFWWLEIRSALNNVSLSYVFPASSSGWSVDVIMASEVAKAVLEMGLLHVDVEHAARVWASRNSKCWDIITVT